jgi:transcriptional regulator with XRE-family HTH domain
MAKRTSAGAADPKGTRHGEVQLARPQSQTSAPRPPKPGRFERVSSSRFEAAEQELRKLFGRNVREARHRAGLTQADVANIVDTDSAYIGTIERGDQNVTLSMVLRLAYAVHTEPGALLLGEAAENYSLETLVRIVGALHSYLKATMDQRGPAGFSGDMLTIIPKPPPAVAPSVQAMKPKKAPFGR